MPKIMQVPNKPALPADTKIYRYLDPKGLRRLVTKNSIAFTRMSTWPDRFEAADFAFFANRTKLHDQRSSDGFFASCWTLQSEDPRLYADTNRHREADKELQHDGSASMWENYCHKGGAEVGPLQARTSIDVKTVPTMPPMKATSRVRIF